MFRLFVIKAAIEGLKRVIAISGKLKPRTWAYLAVIQAVLAALCFWGYQHYAKHVLEPAPQIAIQVQSDQDPVRQDKIVFQNNISVLENEITHLQQTIREIHITLQDEAVGTARLGRTGKVGAGSAYEEAAKKLRHNQQLLASAEDQLKRSKRLFATADNGINVAGFGLAYIVGKYYLRLSPKDENSSRKKIDPAIFDSIVSIGFSKQEEATLREALLPKFTTQNAEAFNRTELRSPRQVVWEWRTPSKYSSDPYSKQANHLGLLCKSTLDNYLSDFSTARAQGGMASPVITNIAIDPPSLVSGTYAVSIYGSNFSPSSNLVIIVGHSSYYSTYSHLWSRPRALIDTPSYSPEIHTHLARQSNDPVVKDIRLLTSTLEEAEAIMSATQWRKGTPAIDLVASDTTGLKDKLTQIKIIHFATHGLFDAGHENASTIHLSVVNQGGGIESGFLQLPFRQLPRLAPPVVLQVTSAEYKSLLDTLVKLVLLFQAIVFTIGSAISSVFIWLNYRRGKLDLKLKELQVREAEIKVENMERDRARAVQEASQSQIVLLS